MAEFWLVSAPGEPTRAATRAVQSGKASLIFRIWTKSWGILLVSQTCESQNSKLVHFHEMSLRNIWRSEPLMPSCSSLRISRRLIHLEKGVWISPNVTPLLMIQRCAQSRAVSSRSAQWRQGPPLPPPSLTVSRRSSLTSWMSMAELSTRTLPSSSGMRKSTARVVSCVIFLAKSDRWPICSSWIFTLVAIEYHRVRNESQDAGIQQGFRLHCWETASVTHSQVKGNLAALERKTKYIFFLLTSYLIRMQWKPSYSKLEWACEAWPFRSQLGIFDYSAGCCAEVCIAWSRVAPHAATATSLVNGTQRTQLSRISSFPTPPSMSALLSFVIW